MDERFEERRYEVEYQRKFEELLTDLEKQVMNYIVEIEVSLGFDRRGKRTPIEYAALKFECTPGKIEQIIISAQDKLRSF